MWSTWYYQLDFFKEQYSLVYVLKCNDWKCTCSRCSCQTGCFVDNVMDEISSRIVLRRRVEFSGLQCNDCFCGGKSTCAAIIQTGCSAHEILFCIEVYFSATIVSRRKMLLLVLQLVKLVVLYTWNVWLCIVLRNSALQYDDCFEEENAFSQTGCCLGKLTCSGQLRSDLDNTVHPWVIKTSLESRQACSELVKILIQMLRRQCCLDLTA